MRKHPTPFFLLVALASMFLQLNAQETCLYNAYYACYSKRMDTLHTEFMRYDTVGITRGAHTLKLRMNGTGSAYDEYYREPLSSGYRKELARNMSDSTLWQQLEKNIYLRGEGWKRPLAKKRRYRCAGRSYVVYGIPEYTCYDPFCSSRHGHARSRTGYLYFSPDLGLLLQQRSFYGTRVLLQAEGKAIPEKLLKILLRKSGTDGAMGQKILADRLEMLKE
ncbi:MAG: hypothetical protein IBJ09_02260 [Bacteroidia bacterium]|nr:hypothetical protein [Bacteroidia bacterium]